MKIEEIIQTWAKNRGYYVAAGDITLLDEVRSSLQKRRDRGEIEENFFRDYLGNFSYLEDSRLKDPRAILIVALPRPAHVLSFSLGSKTVETVLPPTYVRYRKIFSDVRDDLGTALSATNCQLELLNAPLKSLANVLGLLSYGWNNIGYIDGLGSYFQLVGLVTDKRIGEIGKSRRPAPKLLSRCRECLFCAKACPTGAIDGDRVLLHGEKCYTLFSESPKTIPINLRPPSIKCLIGCMRCQQVCPENRGLLRYEKAAVSFDAEETAALLKEGGGSGRVADRAREKFHKLGLTEDVPIFVRNLKRMLKLRRIATY